MSDVKSNPSYEEISLLVDGILFGHVKEGSKHSKSPRTDPFSFSGMKYIVDTSTVMSSHQKALLLKRIELYVGISQPLYSPAIHQ